MDLPAPDTSLEIELCGRLADPLGPLLAVTLPEGGCTVAQLLARIVAQHPGMKDAIGTRRILACVDDAIVAPDAVILPGQRVAMFPPVSGG